MEKTKSVKPASSPIGNLPSESEDKGTHLAGVPFAVREYRLDSNPILAVFLILKFQNRFLPYR